MFKVTFKINQIRSLLFEVEFSPDFSVGYKSESI